MRSCAGVVVPVTRATPILTTAPTLGDHSASANSRNPFRAGRSLRAWRSAPSHSPHLSLLADKWTSSTRSNIHANDELFLDDALDIDAADDPSDYPCHCGLARCRGTSVAAVES
jgi:hypothetical protein